MSSIASSNTASPRSALKEHKPTDDVEDDQKSTISQESGFARADGALHALKLVAGNRVRHGRCTPEFLEEMSTKGANDGLRRFVPKKFKVISGQEAKLFFKKYVSEYGKSIRHVNDKTKSESMPSPIAFAVSVWEGTIKCVDYYMTWRGIKKGNIGQEIERRIDFLDAEFRGLVRKLDDEYSRITSLRMHENLSPIKRKFDNDSDSQQSARKSRPHSRIMLSVHKGKEEPVISGLPEPPVSAADSVMSLPLLNMVRNVPFSHRVPLKVTNPDRLSVISDTDTIRVADLSDQPKLKVEPQTLSKNNNPISVVPNLLQIPRHEDGPHRPYDTISRTRPSKPSGLSRSSSLPRSENRSSSMERNPAGMGEKQPFTDDDLPEFLIVFLGDKPYTDFTSWHGLERQNSIRSLPPDRHSPWIGPLANSDDVSQRYSTPRSSADIDFKDIGAVEGWNNTPIAPMKALVETMGLVKPYYQSSPVIPGAHYLSVSQTGSPAPSESSYIYSSPQVDSSPYVPWQMQIPPNVPHSRPPSRAYSAISHGSPYMHSHIMPF